MLVLLEAALARAWTRCQGWEEEGGGEGLDIKAGALRCLRLGVMGILGNVPPRSSLISPGLALLAGMKSCGSAGAETSKGFTLPHRQAPKLLPNPTPWQGDPLNLLGM